MEAKTNQIYFVIGLMNIKEVRQRKLADCLTLVRLLDEPLTFQINDGNESVFQLDEAKVAFAEEIIDDEKMQRFTFATEDSEFMLSIYKQRILFRGLLPVHLFKENEFLIEDFLNREMRSYGSYAYIRAYDEYLYHNTEDLSSRDFDTPEEQAAFLKLYGEKRELLVDCSQLAGYDLMYQGLCFTACYKMWFSQYYYQYIPREIFLELQQIHKIQQLGGGGRVLAIQLYADPLRWTHKVNLNCQFLFRDQLGFDQFSKSNGIGVLRQPRIEYSFQQQGIRSVQYQNKHLQPEVKSRATHFVMKNTDLVTQQTKTQRNFGKLNSLAYFPWQDEGEKQMMNYLIIDPTKAEDNGLEAYSFYIREYLDIQVADERYDQFLAILRLYIPEKCFKTLSHSALMKKFADSQVKVLKQAETALTMEFKKAENHLQVMFLTSEKIGDALILDTDRLKQAQSPKKTLWQRFFPQKIAK